MRARRARGSPALDGHARPSLHMAKSFETSDRHAAFHLKPLRVPIRVEGVFEEAKNLVEDLPNWTLESSDEAQHVLRARRSGGLLSGASTITVRCEGPDGMPSTTVHVHSESQGGLLSRDKANVLEFMVPFHRRVC
jgi:hypothetical protein